MRYILLAIGFLFVCCYAPSSPASETEEGYVSLMKLFCRSDVVVKASRSSGGYASVRSGDSKSTFYPTVIYKGSPGGAIVIGGIPGELDNGSEGGSSGALFLAQGSPSDTFFLFLDSVDNGQVGGSNYKLLRIMEDHPLISDYLNILDSAQEPLETNGQVVSFLSSCLDSNVRGTVMLGLLELRGVPVKQVLTTSDISKLVRVAKKLNKHIIGRPERFNALYLLIESGDLVGPFLPE